MFNIVFKNCFAVSANAKILILKLITTALV